MVLGQPDGVIPRPIHDADLVRAPFRTELSGTERSRQPKTAECRLSFLSPQMGRNAVYARRSEDEGHVGGARLTHVARRAVSLAAFQSTSIGSFREAARTRSSSTLSTFAGGSPLSRNAFAASRSCLRTAMIIASEAVRCSCVRS